jgi:hypothetical protein
LTPSDSLVDASYYPPMAIKFALRYRNKNMLREAWFYEGLFDLQGVIVPRCYGLFSAELSKTLAESYVPWKQSKQLMYPDKDDNREEDLECWGSFSTQYETFVENTAGLKNDSGNWIALMLLMDLC